MNLKSLLFLYLSVLTFFYSSCKKNTDPPIKIVVDSIKVVPPGRFLHGIFIVHEGQFNHGNSSISYFNPDSSLIMNDLFTTINNRSLGDVAQSISYFNGKFYIVVNNSNKIEIVDQNFYSTGVITNMIELPRYMLKINNKKAYVSQWGASGKGNIAIIDSATNSVINRIPLGFGPEKMILYNNFVYVCNEGGFTNDSIISVIDISTDKVVTSIKVGYNPTGIQIDKNNKIWVLCKGMWKSDYSSLDKKGSLVQLDPIDNTVKSTIELSSAYTQPESLGLNQSKDKLIFNYDSKVYELSITSSLPEVKINHSFYKLGVNPANGDVYATDTKDFKSSGWLFRYNKLYLKVDSFKVSILPGEIMFN